jgi:bifunctional DNA-binding transcriptional regulator/antitoxin component of YhaV-PrlF toxin-antitoxin module
VVIPKSVRERHKLKAGDDLWLLELSNGDLLLRHVRRPRKSLAAHLQRLRGLSLDRNREKVREVAW